MFPYSPETAKDLIPPSKLGKPLISALDYAATLFEKNGANNSAVAEEYYAHHVLKSKRARASTARATASSTTSSSSSSSSSPSSSKTSSSRSGSKDGESSSVTESSRSASEKPAKKKRKPAVKKPAVPKEAASPGSRSRVKPKSSATPRKRAPAPTQKTKVKTAGEDGDSSADLKPVDTDDESDDDVAMPSSHAMTAFVDLGAKNLELAITLASELSVFLPSGKPAVAPESGELAVPDATTNHAPIPDSAVPASSAPPAAAPPAPSDAIALLDRVTRLSINESVINETPLLRVVGALVKADLSPEVTEKARATIAALTCAFSEVLQRNQVVAAAAAASSKPGAPAQTSRGKKRKEPAQKASAKKKESSLKKETPAAKPLSASSSSSSSMQTKPRKQRKRVVVDNEDESLGPSEGAQEHAKGVDLSAAKPPSPVDVTDATEPPSSKSLAPEPEAAAKKPEPAMKPEPVKQVPAKKSEQAKKPPAVKAVATGRLSEAELIQIKGRIEQPWGLTPPNWERVYNAVMELQPNRTPRSASMGDLKSTGMGKLLNLLSKAEGAPERVRNAVKPVMDQWRNDVVNETDGK